MLRIPFLFLSRSMPDSILSLRIDIVSLMRFISLIGLYKKAGIAAEVSLQLLQCLGDSLSYG